MLATLQSFIKWEFWVKNLSFPLNQEGRLGQSLFLTALYMQVNERLLIYFVAGESKSYPELYINWSMEN